MSGPFATLELSRYETEALHIATRNQLLFHGVQMIDETPHPVSDERRKCWYSKSSHIDSLVRLHARLNRILTGHKQYNAVIEYTRRPKS